ncbi:tail fiber protein [Bacillus sp. OxB-1]|uniref:phage tail protein n=1 Tax=Bacillus sp. (strain OxB-1) TaxID=98228 RepID=UPI0005822081|nr:phage tail protein [Bacillus sp. OxB-1]BAQ11291.1 tail fiber protein [Bacillus sp. OxB-1]
MVQYGTIITNIGLAKITNAQITQDTVDLLHIALGDGNGAYYVPSQSQTTLKKEVWRGVIADMSVSESNPNRISVSAYISSTVGGFTIREIGLFDTENNLIALSLYPEQYKPQLSEGVSEDVLLHFEIETSNASVVNLAVDPTIIIASRKYVDDKVASAMGNTSQKVDTLQTSLTAHLADYTQFKSNVQDLIMIKSDIVILSANWIDDRAISGFWIYDLANTDIDASTVVDVNIHLSSLENASDLKSATESFAGYVRLYADEKPTTNITADLKLIRESGVV